MASEYDPTNEQPTDERPVDQTVDGLSGGSAEGAAPAEPDGEPVAAPRTRTRKTAAKSTTAARPAKAAKTAKTAKKAQAAATETAATAPDPTDETADAATDTTPVKKATRTRKKAAAKAAAPAETLADLSASLAEVLVTSPAETESPAPAKRGRRRAARPAEEPTAAETHTSEPASGSLVDEDALRFDRLEAPVATEPELEDADTEDTDESTEDTTAADGEPTTGAFAPLFQAPTTPSRRRRRASAPAAAPEPAVAAVLEVDVLETADTADAEADDSADDGAETEASETSDAPRRRRRRGGKGRRSRSSGGAGTEPTDEAATDEAATPDETGDEPDRRGGTPKGGPAEADTTEDEGGSTTRRRTRRRRRGGGSDSDTDEPGVTTKVRESRRDEVTALKGSTRLEAKKQRRREGREAGRRRTVITEAEFLARRESVERVMVVRHVGDRTQIGVLEDGVLVEHYISKETSVSMAGNIYLGRVQNVLPSMEAAFVDIGKGRNAVLYAGEVNWDAAGMEANQPKRIENALTSGESVLVQVTKDPIGHKGARLTSQISLPGRYLVYVPNSGMTGISRKLPDTERARLKKILKEVVPDTAGVIVRTAAEGASEEELKADVERLTATWAEITEKAEAATGGGGKRKNKGGSAPLLLHGEPDLTVRVIRDIFNEDFAQLVVAGDEAWQEVSDYVTSVAPDLAERASKWTSTEDLFTHYRVDEQIAKAMDRKVWLPSGGSLVIDRTEAMTVVDVNTGKFIGSGGNLEETVTKNNIEAAEEIVRQLRLRDVGGIIVIDFIDMVLESNRDLVVRRLLECLGRDRTKHQVAEVTSLGLVQMTRKRVGSGLIEVFSETCEACGGRGIIVHSDPVDKSANGHEHTDNGGSGNGRTPAGRTRGRGRTPEPPAPARHGGPSPAQIAAAAHAAAMKSNGDAGDGTGASGQDGPLDVVLELDLEEIDTVAADSDDADDTHDAATEVEAEWTTVAEPVEQPAVEDAPAHTEPVDVVDVAEVAEVVEPVPPIVEHTPEPVSEPTSQPSPRNEPDPYAEVVTPPSRPRRHRGRVVAPAGPPRSANPGGGTDG